MRPVTMLLMTGVLAASLLAGCDDDDNSATAPNTPPTTSPPSTPPPATPPPATPPPATPPPSTPPAAPATAAVTVGDIFFKSDLNGSSNPAVDTVAVNGTVTWTWATSEALPHSVESVGSPSFTSSGILTGSGSSYSFTFTAPGTYQYDCAVHGQMMTGTIVVLAATPTSTPPSATPPPATPPPATPPSRRHLRGIEPATHSLHLTHSSASGESRRRSDFPRCLRPLAAGGSRLHHRAHRHDAGLRRGGLRAVLSAVPSPAGGAARSKHLHTGFANLRHEPQTVGHDFRRTPCARSRW